MIDTSFFNRDPQIVAMDLLGAVINFRIFKAMIIETEAYYLNDKASHASLGFTPKKKALFMKPGTIYMYYARGGDSLNFSCRGKGNAVLIKSAYPLKNANSMKKNFPENRTLERLCNGQTLLCKAMGIKVREWDQKILSYPQFFLEYGQKPGKIIQGQRLGIPKGRDEHLPYRFIHYDYAKFCTKNILNQPSALIGKDYVIKDFKRKDYAK